MGAIRREPEETRERLLSAATALFAQSGFHGTTVREIAERARANVAAASYHFGSKEALYLAVLRTQFAEVRERLEQSGAQLLPADLDRLGRAALADLLRSRITAMLEFLLGPPPALHGPLMIREMTDPSEALPVVVAEFIEPQLDEVGGLLKRLEPALTRSEVESCIYSIMGQVLFYSLTRPAQLLMRRRSEYPRGIARQLAAHIAEFSLGGMRRLAERRTGARRAG